MDNYSKVKSVILQLEILGNGLYDGKISDIQAKLSNEPYTATDSDVNYASTILTEVIEKSNKNQLKKLNKYNLNTKLVGDPGDDFINDNKIDNDKLIPSAPSYNDIDKKYKEYKKSILIGDDYNYKDFNDNLFIGLL